MGRNNNIYTVPWTHSFIILASDALVPEGMGNLDKNGSTSNSPIEQRWLLLLFFSLFFRLDEAEQPLLEVPMGGPYRHQKTNFEEYFYQKNTG